MKKEETEYDWQYKTVPLEEARESREIGDRLLWRPAGTNPHDGVVMRGTLVPIPSREKRNG